MKRLPTLPRERRVLRPKRPARSNADFPEVPDFETADIIGPGNDRPDNAG
jgi:hypothetical protein